MTIEGLGKKFQEARNARKLTLDEAARMTKIRPSRLAEIEADDFSQFPSLTYAKGFLLIYGKFLDVDVTPYMEAFEGSEAVTVDGYSYLQDNPAPKPARTPIVPHRPAPSSSSGKPASLMPLVFAVVVVVVGYMAMKLILNLQRIAPHRAEPAPVAQASVSAPSYTAAPVSTPAPTQPPKVTTAAPTPAETATPARVAATTPSPAATQAPKIAVASPTAAATQAPKVAVASPTAAATQAPKVAVASPTAAPSTAPAVSATVAPVAAASPSVAATAAEPEVRRAVAVQPEDLVKSKPAAGSGPNRMDIRPLKKTYVKVVVDNEASTPAFERWISPSDGPVVFRGQHFSVRVLDREAVQIKKNGKSVAPDDSDITIE
jgi:cytoskeletal protein RodZ